SSAPLQPRRGSTMQGRPAFDDLVRRCGGKPDRTSVKVRCVVHEDASPSLSITLTDDGTVLWYCHAGCDQTAVTDAIRHRWPDLWKPVAPLRPSTRPVVTPSPAYRHVCYYTYTDETGTPVHRVERREATDATGARRKDFPQSHWNGTGWSSGTKPLPTLRLYHLPDIIAAANQAGAVWYCEGEKDADRLRSLGLVATTNAKETETLDRLDVTPLQGYNVCILVDNDDPGRKTADNVARKIATVARVKILALPGLPEKGDVSDWLDAGTGTVDDLWELMSATPEWQPTDDDAAGIAHVVEPEPATKRELEEKALHGLAGDVVRLVDPHTEADPAAVLASFIVAFGNAVGTRPHHMLGAETHHARAFALIVGTTGTGRKGASWAPIRELMTLADGGWSVRI
ncbi:MAG: hypothetical protein EBU40_16660, partial [Proteobacteria bacterium]|nr:hypothetical protein [Pseudomonadota bacterium]